MSAGETMTAGDILALVADAVAEVARGADVGEVSMDTTLASLGLDSMAATEMAAYIEDRLGLLLPDHRLAEVVSVRDLVAVIRQNLPDAA